MTLYEVTTSFTVDPAKPPPWRPYHDAVGALKGMIFEASSIEQAEHYGELIKKGLIAEGDRP